MLKIRIGVMPGRIEEYALENGVKVQDALEIAKLNASGYQIKINGNDATLDTELKDNDLVLLVKQIKGN